MVVSGVKCLDDPASNFLAALNNPEGRKLTILRRPYYPRMGWQQYEQ